MRTLILFLTLALTPLIAQSVAGSYVGTWSGAASGDFRLTLTPAAGDAWKADVSFTMGGEEYKTKVVSVKVDGNKLDVTYQYSLQGNDLQSKVTGELKGKTFEGTYKATTVGDGSAVDEGTWKASARE